MSSQCAAKIMVCVVTLFSMNNIEQKSSQYIQQLTESHLNIIKSYHLIHYVQISTANAKDSDDIDVRTPIKF